MGPLVTELEHSFPAARCSIKSLKLAFSKSIVKKNELHHNLWTSFITMFTNLESLEIECANFQKCDGSFIEKLVSGLPLKELTFTNCLLGDKLLSKLL
jgi:hypothetical protein